MHFTFLPSISMGFTHEILTTFFRILCMCIHIHMHAYDTYLYTDLSSHFLLSFVSQIRWWDFMLEFVQIFWLFYFLLDLNQCVNIIWSLHSIFNVIFFFLLLLLKKYGDWKRIRMCNIITITLIFHFRIITRIDCINQSFFSSLLCSYSCKISAVLIWWNWIIKWLIKIKCVGYTHKSIKHSYST